jgi:hypothetical protein
MSICTKNNLPSIFFPIGLKSWSLYLNQIQTFDGTIYCCNNDDDYDVCKL